MNAGWYSVHTYLVRNTEHWKYEMLGLFTSANVLTVTLKEEILKIQKTPQARQTRNARVSINRDGPSTPGCFAPPQLGALGGPWRAWARPEPSHTTIAAV